MSCELVGKKGEDFRMMRAEILYHSRSCTVDVLLGGPAVCRVDSVFGKKCKMLFALLDDVFTGCCVQRPL
jgi:hypothetical protein